MGFNQSQYTRADGEPGFNLYENTSRRAAEEDFAIAGIIIARSFFHMPANN